MYIKQFTVFYKQTQILCSSSALVYFLRRPSSEEPLQADTGDSTEILPRANKPYHSTQHNYKPVIEHEDPPCYLNNIKKIPISRYNENSDGHQDKTLQQEQNILDETQSSFNNPNSNPSVDTCGLKSRTDQNITGEKNFTLNTENDKTQIAPVLSSLCVASDRPKKSGYLQTVREKVPNDQTNISLSIEPVPTSQNQLSPQNEEIQWRVDESHNFDNTIKQSSESINKLPIPEEIHWINTMDDSIRNILDNHRRRSHDFRRASLKVEEVNRRASDGGQIYDNCRACDSYGYLKPQNREYLPSCPNGSNKYDRSSEVDSYPKPSIVLDYHFNESTDNDSISVHMWPELEEDDEAFQPTTSMGGYYCQPGLNDEGDEASTDENEWPSPKHEESDENSNNECPLSEEMTDLQQRLYAHKSGSKECYNMKYLERSSSGQGRLGARRVCNVESIPGKEFGSVHVPATQELDSCLGMDHLSSVSFDGGGVVVVSEESLSSHSGEGSISNRDGNLCQSSQSLHDERKPSLDISVDSFCSLNADYSTNFTIDRTRSPSTNSSYRSNVANYETSDMEDNQRSSSEDTNQNTLEIYRGSYARDDCGQNTDNIYCLRFADRYCPGIDTVYGLPRAGSSSSGSLTPVDSISPITEQNHSPSHGTHSLPQSSSSSSSFTFTYSNTRPPTEDHRRPNLDFSCTASSSDIRHAPLTDANTRECTEDDYNSQSSGSSRPGSLDINAAQEGQPCPNEEVSRSLLANTIARALIVKWVFILPPMFFFLVCLSVGQSCIGRQPCASIFSVRTLSFFFEIFVIVISSKTYMYIFTYMLFSVVRLIAQENKKIRGLLLIFFLSFQNIRLKLFEFLR